MNAFRTSLVLTALALGGLLSTACSGNNEESADPTGTGTSDLLKTPAPAPTVPSPTPKPAPPTDACTTGALGNAKTICSTDAEFLGSAEDACAASKLLIKSFSPDEGCGKGSSNSATYECCPAGATEPPPPPPVCTGGGFASANGICTPDAQMRASAAADCAAEGLGLTSFTPDEKCGKGSSNSATYSCCPVAKPL